MRPVALFGGLFFGSSSAMASEWRGEGFDFVFNGAATVAMVIGGLMAFLGYRLIVSGVHKASKSRAPDKIDITTKLVRIAFSSATPGVMFAGLGAIIVCIALMSLVAWNCDRC